MVTSGVTFFPCKLSRLTLQAFGMENEAHPLTQYLERTGRTLTEVADAAQCSRMTLYRLMKGEQNATIDLLKRISAATGGEVGVQAFLGKEHAA